LASPIFPATICVVDMWASGDAYEPYVGRWSRLVAREFVAWLNVPPARRWLDVGCGTGALTRAILDLTAPVEVKGIDPSEAFVAYAYEKVRGDALSFEVGDAQQLSLRSDAYDAVVSGLVLNFLPSPERGLAEMARVARPGGTVAAYVWDYSGKMQLMRYFWDAAVELDPAAVDLDEGQRFPICRPEPLRDLFRGAGLEDVETRAIDVPTHFRSFDDYWMPFLGGQAPAPSYASSLSEERRVVLGERIRRALPIAADGSIDLVARAWAARGRAR
jgi:SAM-dependent methyltransferase